MHSRGASNKTRIETIHESLYYYVQRNSRGASNKTRIETSIDRASAEKRAGFKRRIQ